MVACSLGNAKVQRYVNKVDCAMSCRNSGIRNMLTEGKASGEVESLTREFEVWRALLEEELLAPGCTKGVSLEGIAPLRLGVIGIVAIVIPCSKFGVRQNFICLVYSGHLLLSFLF